jgi:hypothetical protein
MESSEATVQRYFFANRDEDYALQGSLRHPDWQMVWPQSGERILSHDAYVGMRTHRPEGLPRVEPLGIGGCGDCWWGEMIIHYADGSRWLGVSLVELRDGLVWRERIYFGQPFSAPDWRAPWVERGEAAIT